jgi:FlaA1/EpsC-like NDP-sugar epimerase/dTDP-4-amino-4,6-dideoxygalactose transaminase
MRSRRAAVAAIIAVDTFSWGVGTAVTASIHSRALAWSVAMVAVPAVMQVAIGTTHGLYVGRWPHGSYEEVGALARTVPLVLVFTLLVGLVLAPPVSLAVEGARAAVAVTIMGAFRYAGRTARESRQRRRRADAVGDRVRVLVVGAGWGGEQSIEAMHLDADSPYRPVALVDDEPRLANRRIGGVRVVGTLADIGRVVEDHGIGMVLIAIPSAGGETIRRVCDAVGDRAVEVRVLPPVAKLFTRAVGMDDIRPVTEADLLGRREVRTDVAAIARYLADKRVLVTGAGGSIGAELCQQLWRVGVGELIMLDRDESALHAVQLSLEGRALLDSGNIVVCDVRDAEALVGTFTRHRPHVVFHAAALKHLPLLEMYPSEAVKTNVLGTLNVLDAAQAAGVERFVNISTDKAADPISVLGYSKRIGERLTAGMPAAEGGCFVSVRFGNVLGSRGSVLTAFTAQVEAGGPITVTHPDVTRFFMTVEEAAQLVIQAGAIGCHGEVLVLDMGSPVRITDVARRLAGGPRPVEITYTGLRPGEKLHEVLFGRDEEDRRPRHPLIAHAPVPALAPAALDVLLEASEPDRLKTRMHELAVSAPPGPRADIDLCDGPVVEGRIHLSPPDVGAVERRMLLDAFDSNWVAPVGPDLDLFEAEFAEVVGLDHGVALASGTAALHLALEVLGVAAGDTVLVPSATFVATANTARYLGASPVFIDSDPGTWNISPELVAEELAARARAGTLPRALVAVDLYGQCADHDALARICESYDVTVVEDAAEALGATYKGRPAGSFGAAAAFSFNGNKIITTSGGGMLVSSDRRLCDRARYLATQARDPVSHYEHRSTGYNYRLSNLLAALGRGQLRRLPDMVRARQATNRFYRDALGALPGIEFMPQAPYGVPNSWLTCVLIDPQELGIGAEELRRVLAARDIEARRTWKPMHLQPLYRDHPVRGGRVSATIFERGLCLPSGSSLRRSDLERIVDAVHDAIPSGARV